MSTPRRKLSSVALAATVLTALIAAGCSRASTETTRPQKAAGCVKDGDRCEFSPGKIGLCTAAEGTSTLTCVSLH
jgi:hypothetical protein